MKTYPDRRRDHSIGFRPVAESMNQFIRYNNLTAANDEPVSWVGDGRGSVQHLGSYYATLRTDTLGGSLGGASFV